MSIDPSTIDPADLARRIRAWGAELGFQQVGIDGTDMALLADAPASDHYGICEPCIRTCPTGKVVARQGPSTRALANRTFPRKPDAVPVVRRPALPVPLSVASPTRSAARGPGHAAGDRRVPSA